MSRSRKKPYITDQNRGKPQRGKAKRAANHTVRQTAAELKELLKQLPKGKLEVDHDAIAEEAYKIANGKAYRKESCSWSIRDWSSHCPKDKKAYRK